VEIKGAAKKIDFYMMLLPDYPRSPPQVRIVNKNLDFKVDSFYQGLKSTTDPYSYLLNEKLATTKNWHPSNTLVNIV
jgi:ubiquitin-protein ligase